MPTIVEVQGVGEVEFPDEMSQTQIADVLRKQYAKPAAQPTFQGSALGGVLQGVRDPVDALAQLAPWGLQQVTSLGGAAPNPVSNFFGNEAQRVRQLTQQNEAAYQASRAAQGREGFDAARLGGNVVSPANVAIGLRAAQATANLPRAAKYAASVPAGAAFGVLQPVTDGGEDFAAQKGEQALWGAALGPAAQAASGVVSRVVSPQVSPNVRTLLDEGVQLTPGQIAGGTTRRIEDSLTSLPIVGDAIRGAQTRSVESFNRAVANRALSPIGKKLPDNVPVGRDAVAYVRDTLGKEYDALLPKLTFNADTQFAGELGNVLQMTRSPAFVRRDQFDAILQDKFWAKLTPQGNANGQSFKTIEEGLKKEAQTYLSSADPDARKLGEALSEVLRISREALVRGNPQQAAKLKQINKGWANYAQQRRAASSVAAEEGLFTPAQFQGAVKAGDRSVGKGRFAAGQALGQDLSDAARATLPSRVPDSGTAGRLATNALVGGGALMIEPNALLAALMASGAYTRPGQAAIRSALVSRPQGANALAQAISQFGPTGALPALLPLAPIGQQ